MRTGNKKTDWGRLWKRNAVVAAIALFVCAAVYLNWNYEQEAQAGKNLGQSTMVGGEAKDPLLTGTGKSDSSGNQTGKAEGKEDGSSSADRSDGKTGQDSKDTKTDAPAEGDTSAVNGAGDSSAASAESATEGGTKIPSAAANSAYFDTARLNRTQARDSALSLLQEAATGDAADETVKNQVNETIQTMADYTVTEAQIENMIMAKGYADCVAFIGEESLSLAVAAPEGGLQDSDTARIVDAVHQAAGFTADQIHIIEVE